MKLRNLFLTAVAGIFALTGCEFFEIEKPPILGVEVTPDSIELPQAGGQSQVSVNTSSKWKVKIPDTAADWLTVAPLQGEGAAQITFDAGKNEKKDRKVTVQLIAGYDIVPITVTQPGAIAAGDGSKEHPFSASEAREWVLKNVESGAVTPTNYYVSGIIHKVQTTFADSGNYGNATFFIADDASDTKNDFEAFQVYYLGHKKWVSGNTDVQVGDEVIVCGPLTNYNGTPETAGKGAAYLYKLNDQVVEEQTQTEITESTVEDFIKSDGATYYRLSGKVSSFTKGTNSTSGKNYMQFNLTDATGTILVYGFKEGEYDKWSGQITDGGTVVLTGTYTYYAAKSQHEVINATIESFEEGQVQTEITESSVEDFIKSDGATYYRLRGKVSSFTKGTNSTSGKNYMQFNLTDATGTILVYGFKDGQYEEWSEKIKDGGTVVLTGTYTYYAAKSQHEVMNTTIEKFTEGEEQTEFEQLTVAAFIQKADPVLAYRLAGKVEDFKIDNPDKKYMSLTLKDDTGSILVYSFVEGQFDEWSASIVKGGDITLRGYYKLYDNTPEVINATIESFQADPDYKFFGVEKSSIKVAADATKATIKVISNVTWSAMEPTGATITRGEGTQEFDYTFEANTDTENEKVYSIIVSTEADVEAKSVTVTITQAKAGQAGEVTVSFTQEQLAAAACKGAVVAMDDVISFTNSTDYGTTEVTELRIYKSQKFTVTAAGGAQITGITIECTANGTTKQGPGCWGTGAPQGYTFDENGPNGYWSGSASSVVFTATDNQVRIKSLTVTYVQ